MTIRNLGGGFAGPKSDTIQKIFSICKVRLVSPRA